VGVLIGFHRWSGTRQPSAFIPSWWLGETITSTPLALAGEIIALIIMTGGIVALAQRSPHVMSGKPGRSGTAGQI
jgi:hypothetical protein